MIRRIRAYLAKQRNISDILSAVYWATRDVLENKKNRSKPPFSRSIQSNFILAWQEFRELEDELRRGHLNHARIRAECGDVMAYLGAVVLECDEMLDKVSKLGGTA
jgi:hypothetical protein